MKSIFLFISFYFLVWTVPHSEAQFFTENPVPQNIIQFSAKTEPALPRKGEHFRLHVQAKLIEGWHVYSIVPAEDEFAPPPTTIQLISTTLEPNTPFYESNPLVDHDPVIGTILSFHKKKADFYQNYFLSPEFKDSQVSQIGSIRYQVCSDRICLPPKTEEFRIEFAVDSEPARPQYQNASYSIDPIQELQSANEWQEVQQAGIWNFLLLAIGAGFLALLTPCVFPMIPITVAFFMKEQATSSRTLLPLTTTFALGMITTYTLSGMLLSMLLGATGVIQLATNGWINLGIGALFLTFGLSMMGFFELKLPFDLGNRSDQLSRKVGGFGGVFLMGFSFTLISFTCTVPFLGTLLVAASQGHWLWPTIGMLVFSTVFATPFFLLGWFPSFMQKGKWASGDWLLHTKVVLGMLEIGAAFKFFSNSDLVWGWGVLDRDFVLSTWILVCVLSGVFLLGGISIDGKKVQKTGGWRFSLAFTLLLFGMYLGRGLNGTPLNAWVDAYLPPEFSLRSSSVQTTMSSASEIPLNWETDYQTALQKAKMQKKPLFIDFTGYTCTNCRWMEKKIFVEPQVRQAFEEEFILLQLYTDGGEEGEKNQSFQLKRFQTLALPLYVILSAEGKVLARHAGIMATTEKFLQFLRENRSPS